jgi:hypothetical protein
MCTLITSKGTDIDENIANQNHATRTPTSQARVFYLRSGSGEDPGSLWSREPPDFRGNSNCRLFAT